MRTKWNRCPNAINLYWGWGSHINAVLCRYCPEWCLTSFSRSTLYKNYNNNGISITVYIILLSNKKIYSMVCIFHSKSIYEKLTFVLVTAIKNIVCVQRFRYWLDRLYVFSFKPAGIRQIDHWWFFSKWLGNHRHRLSFIWK